MSAGTKDRYDAQPTSPRTLHKLGPPACSCNGGHGNGCCLEGIARPQAIRPKRNPNSLRVYADPVDVLVEFSRVSQRLEHALADVPSDSGPFVELDRVLAVRTGFLRSLFAVRRALPVVPRPLQASLFLADALVVRIVWNSPC